MTTINERQHYQQIHDQLTNEDLSVLKALLETLVITRVLEHPRFEEARQGFGLLVDILHPEKIPDEDDEAPTH